MQTCVIIPTLNEAANIRQLVTQLLRGGGDFLKEVIVVDGGSEDGTVDLARQAGARVLCSPQKGRALQMNFGAKESGAELLYFVHGDTLPPLNYMADIQQSLKEGYPIGCFRFRFNSPRAIFKINNYITRFNPIFVRGGDQSLFVTKEVFEALGGYRDDYVIMEDYDFIRRALKKYTFKVIQNDVLVSARKYDNNSYLRVQLANVTVFTMYRLGFSQERLVNTYKKMLDYR